MKELIEDMGMALLFLVAGSGMGDFFYKIIEQIQAGHL